MKFKKIYKKFYWFENLPLHVWSFNQNWKNYVKNLNNLKKWTNLRNNCPFKKIMRKRPFIWNKENSNFIYPLKIKFKLQLQMSSTFDINFFLLKLIFFYDLEKIHDMREHPRPNKCFSILKEGSSETVKLKNDNTQRYLSTSCGNKNKKSPLKNKYSFKKLQIM